MEFERFDLSVTRAASSTTWISAVSRIGAVHGVPAARSGPSTVKRLMEGTTTFRKTIVRQHRNTALAEQLGAGLRDLAFGASEVRTLFERTRGAAADRGRPLLVRILATPPEVAELAWELMLDPGDAAGGPLTLAADVHLVRLARVRTYPTVDRVVDPPLRILLVLSSPLVSSDGGHELMFDAYEEKRRFLESLSLLIEAGHVQVEVEDRPTIENLRLRIAAHRRGFHVVHYIGHAVPQGLKLETAEGRECLVDANRFAGLLRQCPDLIMVVFAGCQTAQPPAAPERGVESLSIAEQCVRQSSPMVIGMRAVLPMLTEKLFGEFFYRALASGRTVADAMRLARAGVRENPDVGQGRLDWAVPCLYVGGETAGSVVDAEAPARPPTPRRPREELHLDIVESEREFMARDADLRTAVDFLARRGPERLLWITGPGDEPQRLLARALDDVGEMVALSLWISCLRLSREASDGDAPDPLWALCKWLAELLDRADGKLRRPGVGWTGEDWWQRLLEDIVHRPMAIVLDQYAAPQSDGLREVVRRLLHRSAQARLVLLDGQPGAGATAFDEAREPLVSPISITPLAWQDVRRWIGRNRPSLLRFDRLQRAFDVLGPELELWSALAEAAARAPEQDLDTLLAEMQRGRREVRPAPTEAPEEMGIRVAVAGPFMRKGSEFAAAITELAFEHGVGGHVAAGEELGHAPIATLMPLTSPFLADGTSSDASILAWLQQAVDAGSDLILCDYGGPGDDSPVQRRFFERLAHQNVLVIAAAGQAGGPVVPAWLPQVLAVGGLGDDGRFMDGAFYDARAGKPDQFAPATLAGSPLDRAVTVPGLRGTTASALRTLAAAVLVWATDPRLRASEVRELLVAASPPLNPAEPDGPRRLDTPAALVRVRTAMILGALAGGPMTLQQLLAACGLRTPVAIPLVDQLVAGGQIERSGGGNRYVAGTSLVR